MVLDLSAFTGKKKKTTLNLSAFGKKTLFEREVPEVKQLGEVFGIPWEPKTETERRLKEMGFVPKGVLYPETKEKEEFIPAYGHKPGDELEIHPQTGEIISARTKLPIVEPEPEPISPIDKVTQLVADIAIRLPTRATASIALGTMEVLDPKGGKEVIIPETLAEQVIWGGKGTGSVLFSEEEIKSVQERHKDVKKFLADFGIEGWQSEGLSLIAIAGITGLDLLPFGGSEKNLARALLKITKLDDTLKILFKAGVPEDVAKVYAPKFAKITKLEDINKGLKSLEGVLGTTKVAPKVVPKAIPEAVIKPVTRVEPKVGIRAIPEVPPIKKPPPIEELGVAIEERIRALVPRVKTITSGIRQGKIITRRDILKAGDELKATLKEAKVSPEDAKWFDDTFKNLKGMEDLAEKMPTITARIDRLANAREVRTLKAGIIEEIKAAKPKIGVKKAWESKFGPEPQKQLDFLRGAKDLEGRAITEPIVGGQGFHIKGNRQQALAKIEENINKYGVATDGVVAEVPPEIARQNALLNMVGMQDMSVAELRSALANIKSLKQKGKLDVLIQQSNKVAELELLKDAGKVEFRAPKMAPEVVGVAEKEMNPILKVVDAIDNAILGVRNVVEKATFAKEFRVADWLGDTIRTARNSHNRISLEWSNTKVRAFKSIFGEKRLGRIYQEMSKEQLVFRGKNALGRPVEIKLSQFEAAYWWGLARDPTNIPLFTKNMDFTPEMFKALDNFVDPRMKRYTNYLMDDWLKTIKKPVNERYRVKFGMDMPENPNYLPRLYGDKKIEEEITNLLIGEAFPGHPSTIPSGVKARIGSRTAFRRISIENVMRRHSEQMNQFVHFDEAISDARRVFMDAEVRSTILKSSGKQVYDTIIKKIDDVARGGMATQMKLAAIDWFIGRFTQATLMLNWVPFLKQLTSFPAFTLGREGLKYRELLSGSMVYARNPVEWTKRLVESDFIFGRLTKGFNRETALAFRRGERSFTIKEVGMSLEEFLGKSFITPTRGGDIVPILPGLTAKYIQVTKKLQRTTKLSAEAIHKRALAAAETLASRTQQSPWIEDLGRIQTANSVGKAISMYATTPIQYLRESIGSVRMWNRGQITTGEMVRTVVTAWIVLPQLFQYVSNGFNWNTDRQMRALLLGPINYYPAAGNLMGTMYDAFVKGETWKGVAAAISPLFSIPENAQQSLASMHRILFTDVKDPRKEWGRFAEKLYTTIALMTGRLPSTAPRTIEGIIDLVEGDTEDPRRIWFSEYALDTDVEEEEEGLFPGLPKIKLKEGAGLKGLPKLKLK